MDIDFQEIGSLELVQKGAGRTTEHCLAAGAAQ